MELQPASNAPRLLRGIPLVERPKRVDVQVVQHHADLLGVRVVFLDQLPQTLGDIQLGALLGNLDVPPSPVWLEEGKQVARSVALVFVVDAFGSSRLDGKRRSRMVEELAGAFVEADGGIQRIIRFFIQVQDVFHVIDDLGVYLGNAPLLVLPWLEIPFFRVSRTVSSEMLSTTLISTRRSASSCIVHTARPSGGEEHANAISVASPRPSRRRGCPERGSSSSAASRPPVTNRRRVRYTVSEWTSSSAAMRDADIPSCECSNDRARRIFRAVCFPRRTIARSRFFCPTPSSTRYFIRRPSDTPELRPIRP